MRQGSGQIDTATVNHIQRNGFNGTLRAPNALFYENDENIGLYMKIGFCYSDIKSFIPEVIAMTLVSIWFSDKKTTVVDKLMKSRR